jgi:hypothetical protein
LATHAGSFTGIVLRRNTSKFAMVGGLVAIIVYYRLDCNCPYPHTGHWDIRHDISEVN